MSVLKKNNFKKYFCNLTINKKMVGKNVTLNYSQYLMMYYPPHCPHNKYSRTTDFTNKCFMNSSIETNGFKL